MEQMSNVTDDNKYARFQYIQPQLVELRRHVTRNNQGFNLGCRLRAEWCGSAASTLETELQRALTCPHVARFASGPSLLSSSIGVFHHTGPPNLRGTTGTRPGIASEIQQ